MVFKIEKAGIERVEEIAELMLSVSTAPRITLEFGKCKREDWLEWNLTGVECQIGVCERAGGDAEALMVVDEGDDGEERGNIAGFAVWGWNPNASSLIFKDKVSLPLPEGTNIPLRQTYICALQKLEDEHRPKEPHYELLELATSPTYQRRGIATKLVSYGLAKADAEKVKVFLTASPVGAKVYKKMGFEEVGRLEVPLEEFGGGEGELHVHLAMVRMPNGGDVEGLRG